MPCAAGKSQGTLLLGEVLGWVEILVLSLKIHTTVEGRGKVSECRCPLEAQISCFSHKQRPEGKGGSLGDPPSAALFKECWSSRVRISLDSGLKGQ